MRTSSQALGLAGLFGLALATIGVYGIVAFAVAMRRREWAIRQALGALPGQVFFTAAADGMILSLVGLALGLLFVLPLAALLGSQLSGVRAFDPLAIGGGCAVLLLAALAASTLPALRAVGIDVMEALRDD